MFKRLRIQFIAIIMVSVAVVLAVVFTGICAAEYQRSTAEVNEALAGAISHAVEDRFGFRQGPRDEFRTLSDASEAIGSAGNFKDPGNTSDSDTTGNEKSDSAEDAGTTQDGLSGNASDPGFSGTEGSKSKGASGKTGNISRADGVSGRMLDDGATGSFGGDSFGGPRIGKRDNRTRSIVPVAVYSITDSSTLEAVSGYTTASIDDDVLSSASSRLDDAEDGNGTFADLGLHYLKRTTETTTYVAFADTSTTESWQTLALNLGIAGLGTLAVFFVISLFLSKWALRPVKEAWDSQRQFVADASHDLKTPLTVILANMSILLKHPEHSIASESQWIESTQVEAEQMQGLVNEMLELAQVESAHEMQNAVKEPVDFSDLVDGETLLFDSIALERNCLFNCDIESGITVCGDESQLHKMVATLVENAFKYVDASGAIEVSLHSSGKNATLAVRNTGTTISADDLPHIFDRFYRTDKARTSGTGGFGLGLAIAREIARTHDGDITCTSSEQAGTTFTVTLPKA